MKRRKFKKSWIGKTEILLILIGICVILIIVAGGLSKIDGKISGNDEEAMTVKSVSETQKDTRVCLSAEYICQYPELPTGCEVTALTMALRYKGFSVSKTKLAEDFLDKVDYPGDFINNFVGSPFSQFGLGIYAPGICKTANRFLKANNTNCRAYDISGTAFEKLYENIEEGNPVLIWTTYYLERPPAVNSTYEVDGQIYKWKSNEHCMLLLGFDMEKNTVIAANPATGIEEYSESLIKKRYNQFNKMAVVIK